MYFGAGQKKNSVIPTRQLELDVLLTVDIRSWQVTLVFRTAGRRRGNVWVGMLPALQQVLGFLEQRLA